MPTRNTIDVNTLRPIDVTVKPAIAVGLPVSRMQYMLQLAGDENAPHFTPDQEPLHDGRAFRATDAKAYYRPQLRVAQRSITPAGPEVRFLKDPGGRVRLQFDLEEVPPVALGADAEPLPVKIEHMTLNWTENGARRERRIEAPTLASTDDPQNAAASNFRMRAGVDLDSDEVDTIYRALSGLQAQATLSVTFSYGYWLDDQPVTPNPPRGVHHIGTHLDPSVLSAALRIGRVPRISTEPSPSATDHTTPAGDAHASSAAGLTVSALRLHVRDQPRGAMFLHPDILKIIREKARERETQSNFKHVNVTRDVAFHFDPALEHNRLIYAAITGDAALGNAWQNIGFGLVRAASFPNTVFRLPDEIRLAFNTELGAPYVVPSLYRDDDGEVRVRVLIRAVPWYDPAMLVRLRDTLRRSSSGALSFANVVVGGYEKAVLRLGGAFPDQIRALGNAQETEVGLEGGFEFAIDLSVEFYRLLAELLVGPVGLTGQVAVTVNVAAGDGTNATHKQVFHVPVRLKLADVANLPVSVTLPPDAVLPNAVTIENIAGVDTRVQGCTARLLQYDTNSVAPLEVLDATVDAPSFPAAFPAGATITVIVTPGTAHESAAWNAIQVELLGHGLAAEPTHVLERIHEVAPTGSIPTQLHVECPLLTRTPLPAEFSNLYRVEVQVRRDARAEQSVVLSPAAPQATVTVNQTLRDVVADAGGHIQAFTYRVRNIYLDHQGQWSEPKAAEGTNLFVFPNSPVND